MLFNSYAYPLPPTPPTTPNPNDIILQNSLASYARLLLYVYVLCVSLLILLSCSLSLLIISLSLLLVVLLTITTITTSRGENTYLHKSHQNQFNKPVQQNYSSRLQTCSTTPNQFNNSKPVQETIKTSQTNQFNKTTPRYSPRPSPRGRAYICVYYIYIYIYI